MTRNEAKDKLLEIMEAVEEVHGECDKCPFHEITVDWQSCPFYECPELWEIEV